MFQNSIIFQNFFEKIVDTLCNNLDFVDFNKYTSSILSFLKRLDSPVASRNQFLLHGAGDSDHIYKGQAVEARSRSTFVVHDTSMVQQYYYWRTIGGQWLSHKATRQQRPLVRLFSATKRYIYMQYSIICTQQPHYTSKQYFYSLLLLAPASVLLLTHTVVVLLLCYMYQYMLLHPTLASSLS